MVALRVGLVGAGPWAQLFHGPMITGGPETELVAVWARREDAAQELATALGTKAVKSYAELLEQVDAVVFAVPPDAQAEYAITAAEAGKALLLEKPLGLSLKRAEEVAEAINASGVVNQMMFTNRYTDHVRAFLADAKSRTPLGAMANFINGACLPGGTFATPWRIELGAVLDLAPHVFDLLDASVGPIAEVSAVGDPRKWVSVTALHENGAVSQAGLSLNSPVKTDVTDVRLFTEEGELTTSFVAADTGANTPGTIRSEFAAAVAAGKSHELDVNRALYVQRLIDRAARSLDS